MSRELSEPCFDDICDECANSTCQCRCHKAEYWDIFNGWVPECCSDHDNLCGVADTKHDACCGDCPEFAKPAPSSSVGGTGTSSEEQA